MAQDKSENTIPHLISDQFCNFFTSIKKGQRGPDSYPHSVSVKKEFDWSEVMRYANDVKDIGEVLGGLAGGVVGGISNTIGGPFACILGIIIGTMAGAVAGGMIGYALGFITGIISEVHRLANITSKSEINEYQPHNSL